MNGPSVGGRPATGSAQSQGQRVLSRRGFLAGIACAASFSAPVVGSVRAETGRNGEAGPITVYVYPGPVPIHTRVRHGLAGLRSGWTDVHRDATAAVADAFAQLDAHFEDDLAYTVSPQEPIGARLGASSPLSALTDVEDVLRSFRDTVRERDVGAPDSCHLLLWWDAFNYSVGYGHVLDNGHVGDDDEGTYTVANVGATELWDSRAVTRNMAIHETIHTFLSDDIVSMVIESGCDHNLGAAVETAPGVREVTPMATAYAGADEYDSGTRWPGRGCVDHDVFSVHDGTDGVDRWEYTSDLSDATLEALSLYVREHFLE